MMRSLALGAGLATALLASGIALAQLPQTPGSHILLSKCDPRPYNDFVESGFHVAPYRGAIRTTLATEYENDAPSAATAVVFGVVLRGKLVGIGEDSGTFAHDARISHELTLTQDISNIASQTRCVVLRVQYENGTAWFNPDPPTF
jgi:hypothetical protein